MRLSGKGVAPGQMDLVDVLGMYVAADRGEALRKLVVACERLQGEYECVRVDVALMVAMAEARAVLEGGGS